MHNSALSLGLALEIRWSMVVNILSLVSLEGPRRRKVLPYVSRKSRMAMCILVEAKVTHWVTPVVDLRL